MDTNSWQIQLRKGAAELVVLALLARGERYGLQLHEDAAAAGPLLSEGALYPLLNRLERERKLASRWVHEEGASHPRKYYRLTATGKRLLDEMRDTWIIFRTTMSTIVENSNVNSRANRKLPAAV